MVSENIDWIFQRFAWLLWRHRVGYSGLPIVRCQSVQLWTCIVQGFENIVTPYVLSFHFLAPSRDFCDVWHSVFLVYNLLSALIMSLCSGAISSFLVDNQDGTGFLVRLYLFFKATDFLLFMTNNVFEKFGLILNKCACSLKILINTVELRWHLRHESKLVSRS